METENLRAAASLIAHARARETFRGLPRSPRKIYLDSVVSTAGQGMAMTPWPQPPRSNCLCSLATFYILWNELVKTVCNGHK